MYVYPNRIREAGTRFSSSRSNDEKPAVAGGWGEPRQDVWQGFFALQIVEKRCGTAR